MTDRDPGVFALLEELVPHEREPRDWQQLLADAPEHSGGRRFPRAAVAFVVLLIIVLIPLTALAVGRGWWFLSAYGPKPVGKVVLVSAGGWRETPWNLTAFRTSTGTICYAVTINPDRVQLAGSTEACGPVDSARPISFLRSLGSHSGSQVVPAYIVGATTSSSTELEITDNAGRSQRIPTIPAPGGLHAAVRFFIAPVPTTNDVRTLTALDDKGTALASMAVLGPPTGYRLANPGKPLPLTHAAIHVLRLHHRSPHIYLLGSANGENLYRLGTKGRCYGTGKASNLRWNPADLVMHILGVISCGGGANPSGPLGLPGPVLDLSIYGQTKGQTLMTVYRLAGIASSSVTAVDLVNADGVSIKHVPVRDGVYTVARLPHGVVAIAPFNPSGVWLTSCGFGKGSLPILFMRC